MIFILLVGAVLETFVAILLHDPIAALLSMGACVGVWIIGLSDYRRGL